MSHAPIFRVPLRSVVLRGTRCSTCLQLVVCWVLLGALLAASASAGCGGGHHASAKRGHLGHGRAPLVIGDSTMIYATPVLGRLGLETDAQGCRQFGQGLGILESRRHAHTLPAMVVLGLGANGPIGGGQVARALGILGTHRVLALVTPRSSPTSEAQIRSAARRHPGRVLLIDWARYSAPHGGWFAGDGLHVNQTGADAYARLIRRSVAPFAFPPVKALRVPLRARGSKRCGVVHRRGHPLRVFVVRGRARVTCVRARELVRQPPLRAVVNWQDYDFRRAHHGPWAWVYDRHDGRVVVAAIAGR